MSSSSSSRKNKNMKLERFWLLLVWILCLTPFFLFFIIHISNWSTFINKQVINQNNTTFIFQQNVHTHSLVNSSKCDLFTGQWVRDARGSGYTNFSCSTIPGPNNCFLYGRKDVDFVNWRWKPNECELARFDPKAFLNIVRGKTLAFIGDSVAKNHVESLLCLLSQEENPIVVYKDSEEHFRTWYYESYDFTLKVIWSPWLVYGEEKVAISGEFHLELDRMDEVWSKHLHDMDYAIISATHWFVRTLYLYNQGNLMGCMNCKEANVSHVDISFALRMAFRNMLKYINDCEECKGLVTWVRTSSPSHFEQGTWKGGKCNRTSILSLPDAKDLYLGGTSLDFRNIQVEEIKKAKKEEHGGSKIELFDITDLMLMRADGHPDIHWDNRYMPGYSDCIHWCLPGPVDVWNDLLLALLKEGNGSSPLMIN